MDKMGSSYATNNAGIPATPRDGAAVEIVGLSYSVLSWLSALSSESSSSSDFSKHPIDYIFPHSYVIMASGTRITYGEWANRIKASFHQHFFVPTNPSLDSNHVIDGRYVNVRGIYKDTVGATNIWPDYQFRPNFLVTMALAPTLFPTNEAHSALALVESRLLGEKQLGIKTLDPSDWSYCGNYDNSIDGPTVPRNIARGWNYHQGPEWLWPVGYWLRARLSFPPMKIENTGDITLSLQRWLMARMATHIAHLEKAPDGGLPELTNAGGEHCQYSCTSQAWSSATLLDALLDMEKLIRKNNINIQVNK
jgi:glycogen debranching enzyme